ncbi:MAG: hypothetical protein F6J93_09515 [Oscillatoria sp. SIO1A7]|nr:hypothetical protein [Oscillatoria sp. SIO1A7]
MRFEWQRIGNGCNGWSRLFPTSDRAIACFPKATALLKMWQRIANGCNGWSRLFPHERSPVSPKLPLF